MAERIKAAVLKTADGSAVRGFESHLRRQSSIKCKEVKVVKSKLFRLLVVCLCCIYFEFAYDIKVLEVLLMAVMFSIYGICSP